MPFTQLGLRATILRAVADAGYAVPTPIQQQAIPIVLEGRDLLGGAQTGTGKTAAFVLPILERLLATPAAPGGRRRHVRALILTPTRELAAQVHESVRTYGRHTSIRTTAVFGGVGMRAQVDALVHGIDILVATPGRLLDHVSQRTVDLGRVEVIVLDEADRMLDMGFLPDIKRVLNLLPTERQSLLFSATYTDEIRALAENLLKDPTEVEAPRETIESDLVEQFVYPSMREGKTEILHSLLQRKGCDSALVFTRTRHGADRLARQLARMGVAAAPIHGNLSQTQRTRALRDFKAGHVSVLVATDIAARGLDIDQLPCVVNYDLPWVPEDYVHRIGRTGRAGTAGEAISLVSSDEVQYLQQIERLIDKRLPRCRVEGLEAFTPEGTLENWGAPRVRPLGAPPRSSAPRSGGPRSAFDGNRSAGPRPAQSHRPARATLDRRWSAERESRAGSLPPVDHSPNMAAVRAARSRSRGPSDPA